MIENEVPRFNANYVEWNAEHGYMAIRGYYNTLTEAIEATRRAIIYRIEDNCELIAEG